MRNEKWKPVIGYEGFYEISDFGRVRALFKAGNFHKPGRILRPWLLKSGYLQVHLMKPHGKRKAFCIHRMLIEAFTGPPPKGCECRHLNGSRCDNSLKNLAWGTHLENVEDSRRHGTMIAGERAGSSKLTEDSVREIRQLYKSGVGMRILALLYDIDRTNVWNIVRHRSWRHI